MAHPVLKNTEEHMRYIKAQDKIPKELLLQIQSYVDGEYLYIPRKPDSKRAWGESTHSKQELMQRNTEIWQQYTAGKSLRELSETFFLTEKSISRILRTMREKT